MRSRGKLVFWSLVGALALATVAAGCIPTVRSRPTSSLPRAAWLKPGKQTRPTAAMKKLAQRLKGADDVQTIKHIFGWVHAHRKPFEGSKRRVLRRRTAAQLYAARTYSGCGDWGILLASLFRAAGLPTVFVEAVQKDWANRNRRGNRGGTYLGHVFLEVHTARGWVVVDSTKPYLWRKYDPKEKNLPRGYYVLAKGYDTWDIGIHNQFQLQWAMDNFAERTPRSRFRELTLPRTRLLRRVVIFAKGAVVSRLRRGLRRVVVRGFGPQLVQRWLDRCDKCEAVALLPADLDADHVKSFYRAIGGRRRLGAFAALVGTRPRLVTLSGVRICVYVRRSADALVRLGKKHLTGPIDATTCR